MTSWSVLPSKERVNYTNRESLIETLVDSVGKPYKSHLTIATAEWSFLLEIQGFESFNKEDK